MKVIALLFMVAAAYHGIALFQPVNDSPLWRHALFVAIDLVCAFGSLKRPPWFVWLFALLAIQQCLGHGGRFLSELVHEGHMSWIDLGVILFMPAALTCLIIDAKGRGRKAPGAGSERG